MIVINDGGLNGHRQANSGNNGSANQSPGAGTGAGPTGSTPTRNLTGAGAGESPRVVVGEVTGWRRWRPVTDRFLAFRWAGDAGLAGFNYIDEALEQYPLLLGSCSYTAVWLPGVNKAFSGGDRHTPARVEIGTNDGFYCHKGAFPKTLIGSPGEIFGEVAMWGAVVEHAGGYRGEYARVTKLYAESSQIEMLKAYGVPIETVKGSPYPAIPVLRRQRSVGEMLFWQFGVPTLIGGLASAATITLLRILRIL
jgi:hypothetical protein